MSLSKRLGSVFHLSFTFDSYRVLYIWVSKELLEGTASEDTANDERLRLMGMNLLKLHVSSPLLIMDLYKSNKTSTKAFYYSSLVLVVFQPLCLY